MTAASRIRRYDPVTRGGKLISIATAIVAWPAVAAATRPCPPGTHGNGTGALIAVVAFAVAAIAIAVGAVWLGRKQGWHPVVTWLVTIAGAALVAFIGLVATFQILLSCV